MCGIYLTNMPYPKEEIEEKLKKIDFRGPDNLGITKVNDVSLGHLRLAILDLDKRSNQPYQFENFHIVYNGEIYNFEAIRDELEILGYAFETTSDTEVLIKGYSAWGKDLLPKLNGMFAFAIYDSIKNEIFCARDRLGVKPFYYSWKEGFFEMCSQLKPLMSKDKKISKEAVSIYLDCGYIPSPYSIFEDVYKLPPGKYLILDLNKKTKVIEEYWNLKTVIVRDISYNQAKEELHELLKDAVKIRMQTDVPLGTFLSGGVDSALVSSIAASLTNQKISTFTIGFDDPKFDESKVAKEFSGYINSNHIETKCEIKDVLKLLHKMVEVYDEPFADSSALPSLLLNSVTKEHVTVALSGDGGDESFLGYVDFDTLGIFRKISILPFFLRKVLSKLNFSMLLSYRPETISSILSTEEVNDLIWKMFTGHSSLQKEIKTNWIKNYNGYRTWSKNPLQKMADLNIKLWLENDSNVKVDRASMAYSVEVRSPFLDYRIIEFARQLPVEYRYQKGVKKAILKDILAEYIPREVFEKPKKGFSVPMKTWLQNELREDVFKLLNDDFLNKVPNLNVKLFNKRFNLHYQNKYDYSFEIWKLYVLAKWNDEFNLL